MAWRPPDLDRPELWRTIHNLWISEICQSLKPQVKGRLGISIDEEVTLTDAAGDKSRHYPDLHVSAGKPERPVVAGDSPATGAVAHAVGVENWSRESRHFIVLEDLQSRRVIGILELLSPTNKGVYSRADLEAFRERRLRLLSAPISYLEIDAVAAGTRWLPSSLRALEPHDGVVWTSLPLPTGERKVEGWAWGPAGPLPRVPWELGAFGRLEVDLGGTFSEAVETAGLSRG
jgi:hypothetical protein